MTTTLLIPEASATIDSTVVDIAAGATTLDLAKVPYATAQLHFPLLDDELLEWLDPRDGVRVQYEAGFAGETPRPFDLGLRARKVDHRARTLTLTLASDEALALDYVSLTMDAGARAVASSLRDVVDYILDKIGAQLEAGGPDLDMTPYWEAWNLAPDASFETGTTAGWAGATNAPTLANSGAQAFVGTRSLSVTATVAGGLSAISPTVTARPRQIYGASIYVRSTVSRSTTLTVRFTNAAGGTTDVASAPLVTSTTGWQRLTVLAVAPADAVSVRVFFTALGNAVGNVHYLDAVMISPDTEILPFFYGSTPADAHYTYAQTGGGAVRTPVVNRPRELFTLKPGDNLWDFLLGITSAAGVVLWCDELRRWRIAYPEERVLPSMIAVTTGNTSEGGDEIDRDDDETFCTGVVVVYEWTDEDGISQQAFDTAGTPEKVLVVERRQPFPGPGAAAAILARRQGTGRRQDVTTVTQTGTTPGMTAQISLPAAPETVGRVSAVTFDHKTGFMDLTAAGLVDIIPGSIAALIGTIDELVGTIDSL